MPGTRRLFGAIVACAALAGVATAPVVGAGPIYHEIGHVVFTGKVQGLLLAKPSGKSHTRMYLSLHGLRPETAYDVVGSKRPCGKSLTNASRLFGLDVHASQDTDEFQSLRLSIPFATLTAMKSVRLIAEPLDGSGVQRSCYVYIVITDRQTNKG